MTPLGSSKLSCSGQDGCSVAASVCFDIFWRIARHLVSTSKASVAVSALVAVVVSASVAATIAGGGWFSRSFLIDIPTSRAAAALLAGEFGLVFRSWVVEDKDDDADVDAENDPIDVDADVDDLIGAVVIGPLPHKSDAAVIVVSLVAEVVWAAASALVAPPIRSSSFEIAKRLP